jgi:YggT family protein
MRFVCAALQIYYWVLLARVLLSWFPRLPDGIRPIAEVVYVLTDPIVRFARPLIPPIRIGMVSLDISILLVFIALQVLLAAVC